MDKFVIRGGNPLVGTVRVSGAKNSALPCMAAAILTEDEVTLENIPQVRDIETERRLLASMGAAVELHDPTPTPPSLSGPCSTWPIRQVSPFGGAEQPFFDLPEFVSEAPHLDSKSHELFLVVT